ncbi:MAG TPA: hypothetical protein VMF87_31355 [Streptosporangiaceae bacterium]|nr:hypothetical protein [Streptosporangiaceae bacterium]
MTPRLLLRAGAPLAVAALALGAGPAAAQAAATPGWSVAQVYGASSGYPDLQGVAASGPDAAWVSGNTVAGLVIDHWNGTSWNGLTPPAAFETNGSASVNDMVIGASSRNDMWTFPYVSATAVVQYALERHDGTWKTFKLTKSAGVNATAVFSPSNVWAFGMTDVPTASGYGSPYVRRYNGKTWKSASMPGDALSVSPLSASDMWAWGPTTKTLGQSLPDFAAMHWNGASWSTLAVPRYVVSGGRAIVQQLVATGPDSLWVAEGLQANRGTGQPPAAGLVLAHWNGHKWRLVARNRSVTGQGGLVGDGTGGVWLQAVTGTSGPDEFLHYSGGQLAAVAEPTAGPGETTSVASMARVPGTTSLWAAASVGPDASGIGQGGILRYVG